MIYTPMTNKAMRIAYAAHHGQVDKCGIPYIFHPLHLAEQMDDEVSCTVALLHDVAEDTDISLEDLSRDFPVEVMKPLALLTHHKDTDYFEYVRAVKADPIAVKVKLADLAHNSDQTRCVDSGLSEEVLTYFRGKYAKAKAILTQKGDD
jgi:(p)ppGpp synthase/HD superfamily hydrolase